MSVAVEESAARTAAGTETTVEGAIDKAVTLDNDNTEEKNESTPTTTQTQASSSSPIATTAAPSDSSSVTVQEESNEENASASNTTASDADAKRQMALEIANRLAGVTSSTSASQNHQQEGEGEGGMDDNSLSLSSSHLGKRNAEQLNTATSDEANESASKRQQMEQTVNGTFHVDADATATATATDADSTGDHTADSTADADAAQTYGDMTATQKRLDLIPSMYESSTIDRPLKSRYTTTFGMPSSSTTASAPQPQSQSQSSIEHNMSKIIYIPSDKIGLLIGRGGETIRKLQDSSRCSINISKDTMNDMGERQVTVRGSSEESIAAAEKAIQQLLEREPQARSPSSNISPSSRSNDRQYSRTRPSSHAPPHMDSSNSEEVTVPNTMVGILIGRGGETIRQIQERSGCHVIVTKGKSK
jgi:hypothetical protein